MNAQIDEIPRCDTCGAEVTTGMMAVFCPRGRGCEFWTHDPQSDDFLNATLAELEALRADAASRFSNC